MIPIYDFSSLYPGIIVKYKWSYSWIARKKKISNILEKLDLLKCV